MVVRYLLVLAVTILACAIPSVSQTSPPTAGSVTVPAKRSPSEVSELLKKARDGDAAAQFEIGRAYDTGEGVRENPQQAAVWYRKSAEQGNPKAQNSLGVLYWSGNGVERSKEQAVRWYRKSARQGDSDAMFNIGAAYYNGEGVENVDAILAYAWFVLSSEAGSSSGQEAARRSKTEHGPGAFSDACFEIARLYAKGEDLPQSFATATMWYRRAADQGHTQAKISLATLAIEAKNYSEARHWCEAAAKDRNTGGYYCLGYIYQNGLGVEQSSKEARKWYEEAAKSGNSKAMQLLGEMYAKGDGTTIDRPEAFAWFFVAARRGNQDALHAANQLRSSMSEKERKDAVKKLRKRNFDPKQIDAVLGGGNERIQ
jgi:uncharacterized protein